MPYIDACPVPALPPRDYQLEKWRRYREVISWGHLWDQGTGKSFECIMQAAWLFAHGLIDAIMVMAPDGVHRNWITEEIPKHWPVELGKPNCCWFRSSSADTNWHAKEVEECLKAPGLAAFSISWDALLQEDRKAKPGRKGMVGGRTWAKRFLTERRVFLIGDETSRIKNPDSKRTRLAMKASSYARYRRILNGTPVPNGPFDIYSQIRFLDPAFWERKGISTFGGFKTQFGIFGSGEVWRKDPKTNLPVKCHFPELKGYKNLEILNTWLAEITDRVLKEDVLDLPPKTYQRLVFDLTGPQRRVYDQLRDECLSFLDSGELVTSVLAITKMLRLQQVTCGYVPVDDVEGDPIRSIGDENPRLDLLGEIVEDTPHKAIIWTRFRRDVDLIMEMMGKREKVAVRYDGQVDDEGRLAAVEAFQRGDAQFFVSNPAAGGEGLTLLGDQSLEAMSCKTVIYYSNGFNLQHRLQSEDRAHRIGQKWPVLYLDLVASDTIDAQITECLKEKMDIASQVTGDKLRTWLA